MEKSLSHVLLSDQLKEVFNLSPVPNNYFSYQRELGIWWNRAEEGDHDGRVQKFVEQVATLYIM